MPKPTVMLADDHTMIADAFRNLLEPEYDVVAIVTDGRALLERAIEVKPDVVVVDVGMPLLNGLAAAQQLKLVLRKVKIIYVTMNENPDLAAEALRTGGAAYLLKSSAASELLKSMREVLRGGTYVTPIIARGIKESFIRSTRPKCAERRLTPRQMEVLQLLAEGKSMKEVGSVLTLTPRTVAFHKYRIMEALNVRTNAELVKFAIANDILSSEGNRAPARVLPPATLPARKSHPTSRSN